MSRHTGWFKEILDCHPETDDSKLTLHRSDVRPWTCVPLNSNHMYKSCFPQISTSRSTSSRCKSTWLERVGVQQWSELVSVKYLTFAHFIKPKGRGGTWLGPLPSTGQSRATEGPWAHGIPFSSGARCVQNSHADLEADTGSQYFGVITA